MSTISNSYAFASDANGWTVATAGGANETIQWYGSDGNPAGSLRQRVSNNGTVGTATPFSIAGALGAFWGVPAGQQVTQVDITAIDWKVIAFSFSPPQHDWHTHIAAGAAGASSTSHNITGTTSFATLTNDCSLTGLAITDLTTTLTLSIVTNFTAGADAFAAIDVLWDNITAVITYSPAPTGAAKALIVTRQAVVRASVY